MSNIYELFGEFKECLSGVMKEENPKIVQMRKMERLEKERKKREEIEKMKNSKK